MLHYVAKLPTIEPDFFCDPFFDSSRVGPSESEVFGLCAINNKKLRSFVFFLKIVRILPFSQACQSCFREER